MKKIIVLICIFAWPYLAWSACTGGPTDWTTDGNEQADVQECLDLTDSGDTVTVITGDGTATWGSITIPEGVSLIGPGSCPNCGSGSNGSWPLTISGSIPTINSNSRLSGFRFAPGLSKTIYSTVTNYRIDNNYFEFNGDNFETVISLRAICNDYNGHPTLLIDHNYFDRCGITTFSFEGGSDPAEQRCGKPWYTNYRDWDYDTEKPYIEDNFFYGTTGDSGDFVRVTDSTGSASRMVFRFNYIESGYLEQHGARNTRRGAQSVEVYENYFDNRNGGSQATNFRVGSGVQFNNFCDDTGATSPGRCEWYNNTERCTTSYDGALVGQCDGNSTGWDTEPHPITGGTDFLCRDYYGGKDASLSTSESESATTPTTALPQQELSRGYFWGNTTTGVFEGAWYFTSVGCNGGAQEFREWFVDSSTRSGPVGGGVSSGLWANIPVCNGSNAYYGYWATDKGGNWQTLNGTANDGALYVCDGVDTWTLRYTPATYPGTTLIGQGPSEVCNQSGDENGDSLSDCADPACDQQTGPNGETCEYATELTCNDGYDNDGDGAKDLCGDSDCVCPSSGSSGSYNTGPS